ncbi:MAG TPA: thiamine pyrophosphate-dependent enzyme [Nitriliruptoraceae bacterium]|nr:thiamine pyrophosphate-dependent enzyme [Nitriliruptoraceae bacterium]
MAEMIAASLAHLDEVLAAPVAARVDVGESTLQRDAAATLRPLDAAAAIDLFTDMVRSRVLDHAARTLRAADLGHYTISSAGHEHTAVIGAHLRRTDPCFLHYRDGGLVMAKSRTHPDPGHDVLAAIVASFVAAASEPASGGRHKVWGDPATWIVPQTSTIGSHPPKAVGAAAMLSRGTRFGHDSGLPRDAIVVATLGDASSNHATTLSALTAARWAHRHGNSVPVLIVVEDNGRGISVPTPSGWVADSLSHLPGLAFHDAGGSIDDVWSTVGLAVDQVRTQRRPVVVRLPTVRLGGHAGSDAEAGYRHRADIMDDLQRDPLALAAVRLQELGLATAGELRDVVATTTARVATLVEAADRHDRLTTAAAVMAPLAPHHPADVVADALDSVQAARTAGFQAPDGALTLAQGLNAALAEQLAGRSEVVTFGEDVAVKGGVYGITKGLQRRFGRGRVFDTLLDETSILGTAQGAGLVGLLPIPEIQYLAYVHNALDQVRGEAATTQFFSDGAHRTPMVVRIAGLAYQRGFGGHFHNDNAIGALRDIPGLHIAVPTTARDAVGMLRAATAMASVDGTVVIMLEPIALYHERDRLEVGDDRWTHAWPDDDHVVLPGDVTVHRPDARGGDAGAPSHDDPRGGDAGASSHDDPPGDAGAPSHDDARGGADRATIDDVAIVTWGNGVRMAMQAAAVLRRTGTSARVVHVGWVAPLPHRAIRAAVADCGAVLVADEARATGGGIADAVVADLARNGWDRPIDSVASMDSFIPLGTAADLVLLDVDDIVAAARRLAAPVGVPTAGDARRGAGDGLDRGAPRTSPSPDV